MTPAKNELEQLIRSKLTDGMTADEATAAIMKLFYSVDDEWDWVDISTYADDGSKQLDQRWIVCRVPRESREHNRVADRTVQ